MLPEPAPDAFTPQEAARELRALPAFEDALRQRAEGVLWMVMGLVAVSLFLAYTLVSVLGGRSPATFAVLWLPFVAAGAAVVWGIRRSLAVDAGADPRRHPEVWLVVGLGVAMLPVAFLAFTDASDAAPAVALLGLSLVAALPAVLEGLRFTRAGRRVSLALAAWGILLSALLLATDAPDVAGAWAGGTTMFLWIAAGLWETLQG